MDTGRDFLRAQINNAIAQHTNLIDAIREHSEQAESPRYRELCLEYLPSLERHQGMLEQYARQVGIEGGGNIVKNALGAVLGKARDAVDAMRESDFLRVVADTVMIRQAQDTFRTFETVGEQIGEPELAQIGRDASTQHDAMQGDFNDLAAEIFVQRVNAVSESERTSKVR